MYQKLMLYFGMETPQALHSDRRFNSRFKVSTPVHIRAVGRPAAKCFARNLSATGVFVETKDLGLSPGDEVELVFAIAIGQTVKLHRRRAQVVYVKAGGTGFNMLSRSLPDVPMTPA